MSTQSHSLAYHPPVHPISTPHPLQGAPSPSPHPCEALRCKLAQWQQDQTSPEGPFDFYFFFLQSISRSTSPLGARMQGSACPTARTEISLPIPIWLRLGFIPRPTCHMIASAGCVLKGHSRACSSYQMVLVGDRGIRGSKEPPRGGMAQYPTPAATSPCPKPIHSLSDCLFLQPEMLSACHKDISAPLHPSTQEHEQGKGEHPHLGESSPDPKQLHHTGFSSHFPFTSKQHQSRAAMLQAGSPVRAYCFAPRL